MRLSETALKLAFFGVKHEASDIIDYLVIHVFVLVSTLVGVIAAIWIGHVVDAPVGLLAGIGFYGLSMISCSFAFLHGHRA
jgi:sorbitol-specific phosphotransferase system component IIBC